MRTITGKVNFLLQQYTLEDFLDDMDRHNIEVVKLQRSFASWIVTVSGKDSDLDTARWYFRNCGTLI